MPVHVDFIEVVNSLESLQRCVLPLFHVTYSYILRRIVVLSIHLFSRLFFALIIICGDLGTLDALRVQVNPPRLLDDILVL